MNSSDVGAIRFEEYIPHPPNRVWRALTDPVLIERWLMPTDFRLEIGHRFQFQGRPIPEVRFGGVVHCEVVDFQLERMLRYRWRDPGKENGLDSTVTWWLEPVMGGTRLVLEHEGFDPENPFQQLSRRVMSGGWESVIRRLAEIVEDEAV